MDFKGICSSGKRGDGTASVNLRAGLLLLYFFFPLSMSPAVAQTQRPDAGSVLESLKPPPVLPKASPEVLPKVEEPRPAPTRRRPRLEPEDEDEDAPEELPEEDEDRPRRRRAGNT